jgi:hypothetical protein
MTTTTQPTTTTLDDGRKVLARIDRTGELRPLAYLTATDAHRQVNAMRAAGIACVIAWAIRPFRGPCRYIAID